MEVQKEPAEVTVKKIEVAWELAKASGALGPPNALPKLFTEAYVVVSQAIREDQKPQ